MCPQILQFGWLLSLILEPPFVLKVGAPYDLAEVATCEDGREWALFWLEDEIGFVDPQRREAYKWDRQTYRLYPELYSRSRPSDHYRAVSDIR